METTTIRDKATAIVDTLRHAGHDAFFVGGCVRDIVRGVEPGDYDIVTSARPEQVRALFDKTVPVGISFGVVLVIMEGRRFEVATFRSESRYEDGRHPEEISFASAEQDVLRRDFTVNGLLMDPTTGRIIDYAEGTADIEKRIIRTIGDPRERFREDHLRMIRAVRFSANLDFAIAPDTLEAVRESAFRIQRISAERIRDELTKMLTRGGARRGLELLYDSGLLAEVLPEVQAMRGIEQPATYHPEGDVWEHTLRMLALLSGFVQGEADPRLAWAVVLHDIGKTVTRSEDDAGVHFYGHVRQGVEMAGRIMDRLRFSRHHRETVLSLIEDHMRFMHVREMRPGRLKRFLRRPDFNLHMELHRLDCLGSHGMLDNYEFCRSKLLEIPQEHLHPPPLLSGDDLIAMGFMPGPVFREILRTVEDRQLSGDIHTADDARRLVEERYGHGL